MNFLTTFLIVKILLCCCSIQTAYGNPVSIAKKQIQPDNSLDKEYTKLKLILIANLGYSEEFADLVEVNLKRAIKEEKERQQAAGIVLEETSTPLVDLRQQEEDYEEDATTGPTTPRASTIDIVRGLAMIVRSVQQLDIANFWGSFVNFFPPGQRASAQALVDASFGRRPTSWPTIPTTTTKLPTTTKDEDEIDSEESTTKAANSVTTASVAATTGSAVVATATVASVASETPAAATVTRAPVVRYAVRARTPASASQNGLTLFQDLLASSSS